MARYVVAMQYKITVEAKDDADAIHAAQYQDVSGNETVRDLQQRIVRKLPETPIAVTEMPQAGIEAASVPANDSNSHAISDIPF